MERKEDFVGKDETDIYLFLMDTDFDESVAKVFESKFLVAVKSFAKLVFITSIVTSCVLYDSVQH